MTLARRRALRAWCSALVCTALLLGAAATTSPAAAAEDRFPVAVTLEAPAATDVRTGTQVDLRGTVVAEHAAVGEGRVVRLHLRTPRGLLPLGSSGTTAADGSFAVRLPTWWAWSGTVVATVDERVVKVAGAPLPLAALFTAAGLGHLVEVVLSGTRSALATTLRVRTAAGRGSATAWRPLMAGGFRFDPCSSLTYRVNTVGAPRGGLRTVHEAMRRIAEASGLRFAYAGRTDAVPFRQGRGPRYARGTRLTIAWATPRQVPALRGHVIGVGGAGGVRAADGSYAVLTQGGVSLDRTFRGPAGFGRGATLGALLMHEIGHAVGLGHAGDHRQVMHAALHAGTIGQWGAGDLTGLRRVGASQGCVMPTALRSARPVATVRVPPVPQP